MKTNLLAYQDKKYKEFQSKLLATKYEVIGVRMPVLRTLAKDLSEEDITFQFKYYEEVLLCGMLIPKVKDEAKRLAYIIKYLDYIDCWSTCDAFCSNLKFVKKNPDQYFTFLKSLAKISEPFHLRFTLVMFLRYYTAEKYLKDILDFVTDIPKTRYYVKMGIAWLLCELSIYYKETVSTFVRTLDVDIQKMYQRKVKDSFRI